LLSLFSIFCAALLSLSSGEQADARHFFSLAQFATIVIALLAGSILIAPLATLSMTANLLRLMEFKGSAAMGVISLLLALVFTNILRETSSEVVDRHISEHSSELSRALTERSIAHSEVLQSLARLIEFSPNLSQEAFDRFVVLTLKEESDIFALSFNPIIHKAERAVFEANQRRMLSNPSFSIKERVNAKVAPSIEHELYVPVAIISPLKGNTGAIGFDIYSNDIRRAAIESALRDAFPLGMPALPRMGKKKL